MVYDLHFRQTGNVMLYLLRTILATRNGNKAMIAECGTGKTLISLGAMFVNSNGRPFTALVMAPPQFTFSV